MWGTVTAAPKQRAGHSPKLAANFDETKGYRVLIERQSRALTKRLHHRAIGAKLGPVAVGTITPRSRNAMTQSDPLLLDNQLCFALYATSLAVTQLYKPLLAPLGLTYPQYLIMLILWEGDGLPLKAIGDRLGQKSGALTPVIKRLESDGLVQRLRRSDDERNLEIRLTAKGQQLRQQATEVHACILRSCATDVEQLGQLKTMLDQLRERLVQSSPEVFAQ